MHRGAARQYPLGGVAWQCPAGRVGGREENSILGVRAVVTSRREMASTISFYPHRRSTSPDSMSRGS